MSPCISHLQLVHIQRATQEDQVLQMLMSKVIEGFPEHIKQLPVVLRSFWQIRDDLSIEHSCLAYQGRYYIPKAIREQALESLHIGHPGMLKMKLRAQQVCSSGSGGPQRPRPPTPKLEHTFCTAWLHSLGIHPSCFKVGPP